MSHEIEQLEFRWTTARQGYFATAASPGAMQWEQHLQPVARPPDMRPSATVVYQTFGESASIVFRHVLQPAGGSVPDQEPLAARALIGPAELLTPDVALGCAALGSPGFLRPGIGRVPYGGELPTLAFSAIWDEAASRDLRLDLGHAARRWADRGGLAHVLLAATLARPDMAVTVHLDFQQTHGRDIAALLWGLWQLADPILRSERDWSFSTGEEPLGIRAQTRLPHLIIRDLGVEGGPPDALRSEIVLSQEERYAHDRFPTQPLADMLAAAYLQQSVREQPCELTGLDPGGTIQDRLDEVSRRLGLPVGAVSPEGQVLPAPDNPLQPAGPEQPVLLSTGPVQPAPNGWDQRSHLSYPTDQGWEWAGESRDVHQAGSAGQHRDVAATPPGMVSSETFNLLLDGLACGNPDDVRRLEHLAAGPHRPGRRHRLALLRRAAEQRWYVRQLDGLRPSDAEICVCHLLVLLAEPDLGDPEHYEEMRQELAGLMSTPGTPGVALLALERIARKRADAGLWDLVARIAGWRWLADLGRSCPAEETGEPGPAKGAPQRSGWRRWLSRRRDGRVRSGRSSTRMARVWLGLFLAETLALCLVLVFR